MIRGVVSIGTNSTRALVADIGDPPHVLLARSTGTRIGEGLKESGHLDPGAVQRTLNAMKEHVAAVRKHTGEITAIATSALRRADDSEQFAKQIESIVGAPLEIISGDEEARRSYIGAVTPLVPAHPDTIFGVLDVGGGSSEYASGHDMHPDDVVSCEIGAVRLTEMVPQLTGARGHLDSKHVEHARELVREALAPLHRFPEPKLMVLVGGSASTAVAIVRGSTARFEYAEVERGELRGTIAELQSRDLEARKAMPGMNPQRADILLAGLLIIDEALEISGATCALASTNDLLLGTALLAGGKAA